MTIKEIQREINKLSADKRQRLLKSLLENEPGIINQPEIQTQENEDDQLKSEGATIQIHDWQGKDVEKPRIVIQCGDHVEELDVIAMLKADSAAISHPAVLLAIYRWQEIIRYHHALERARFKKPSKYKGFRSIAEKHLQKVAKAIIEGAKERAITVEDAFFMMQYGWAMAYDYYVLKWVWERLGYEEIKSKHTNREKLNALGGLYKTEPKESLPLSDVGIPAVIQFLKSQGIDYLKQRPSWRVMRAQFDKWRFGLGKGTLKTYRRKAKLKYQMQEFEMRFIRPDLGNEFLISDLPSILISLYAGLKNSSK